MMDRDLEDFRVHMEHKLLAHKNKGGYNRLTIDELMKLMHQEVRELKVAVEDSDMVGIINESADIANFCMMIAMKVQNRRTL